MGRTLQVSPIVTEFTSASRSSGRYSGTLPALLLSYALLRLYRPSMTCGPKFQSTRKRYWPLFAGVGEVVINCPPEAFGKGICEGSSRFRETVSNRETGIWFPGNG